MHSTEKNPEQRWFCVGIVEDIPLRGARKVKTADGDIAVFRAADGEVFALRDRCPHRGGPLSQGMVCGRHVVCPLHEWRIDIERGEAIAPDCGAVPRYEVRIDGSTIWLSLPVPVTEEGP